MNKIKYTLLVGVALILSVGTLSATYLDKIQLEQDFSHRVQVALDSVYGAGNFIASVTVTMTKPSFQVRYTEQSKAKVRKGERDQSKYQILPGYPVIRNLGPDDFSKLPFDSITTYIEPKLRRIDVNLIINRALPKAQAARAKLLVKEVLPINEKRGDKIVLDYKKFYAKPDIAQKIQITQAKENVASVQNLFYFLLLIIILIALFMYVMISRRQSKLMAATATGGGSEGGNISVSSRVEMPKGAGAGGRGGDVELKASSIKRYFDFVSHDNILNLVYVMKKEQLKVEDITNVISYLPADLATILLAELDIKHQATVATKLLSETTMERPLLEKLETKIKNSLECLVGGKSVFEGLFNLVSNENKKKLLTFLSKSNPSGYKQVRSHIIVFDDLRLLTDDEIKQVLSDVNLEMLSTALVKVDEQTYQKIDKNLTQAAKDMISQFLELKGKAVSKKEVEIAQAYVIEVVDRLESEGKINLRGKIKV